MKIANFVAPETTQQAYELAMKGENNIVGGGAWMRQSNRDIETLIGLDKLGLDTITVSDDTIHIGSMVTLRDIELSPYLQELYSGILPKAVSQIMGLQVRNIATIGGSIMGRYSFSDIIPVLLVMDTTLVFHHQQEMSLQAFLDDKKVQPDILLSIKIKREQGNGYFKKVCKTLLSFSLLNIAISNKDGMYRIQVGARPGLSMEATKTMTYLNETNNISDQVIEKAVAIALDEIKLSDNSKASKEYREDLLQAYLSRGIKEVR